MLALAGASGLLHAAPGFLHGCVQGEMGKPSIVVSDHSHRVVTITVSTGDYGTSAVAFVVQSMDVVVTGKVIDITWRGARSSPAPPREEGACGSVTLGVGEGPYTVNFHLDGTAPNPPTLAATTTFQARADTSQIELFLDPDCPAPDEDIAFVVNPGGGFALNGPQPLSLERHGSTFKVVAAASSSYFPELPGQVRGSLGRLPAGEYRFDFHVRYIVGQDAYGPETFVESKTFRVAANTDTCAARTIDIVGSPYRVVRTGTTHPEPMRVIVKDAHGHPVPGAMVLLNLLQNVVTDVPSGPPPDMATRIDVAATDSRGMLSIPLTTNDVPGTFQYSMALRTPYRDRTRRFFIVHSTKDGTSASDYPLVEFRRGTATGNPHFFMTGNFAEMAKLDDLPYEWMRTGGVVPAYAPGKDVAGSTPVCRYYGLPSAGLDSHFFSGSPQECAEVGTRFAGAWLLETPEACRAHLPDPITGACPANTRALYRAFNNLPDANHRYALNPIVATFNQQTTAEPAWTLEGYGPGVVALCVPR